MSDNLILNTDSYKLGHWHQYPAGTTGVFSYLEARQGAEFPETVFFGLQSLLRQIEGKAFDLLDIVQAESIAEAHFGTEKLFNKAGWQHIHSKWDGRLPIRIKAVPEGTPVPAGNALMTVENTDPEAFWLTNALESLLLHVWYPTTVASLSRSVKKSLAQRLTACGAGLEGLPFMLHDFGYRGVSSNESAALGGAAHLVNFQGTDTLVGMMLALRDYNADLATLGFSVPATEHSVMTSLGREGEHDVVENLLRNHDAGILSVVADSYNIYQFVQEGVCNAWKDRILARDGVFVVRPDSVTREDPTPDRLVKTLLGTLWDSYGGTTTPKGFKVLDPHVRLLWGDGIDPHGIELIVDRAMLAGFSPENLVFGMGGGLLQKVNRDTQRFAFKSSAQERYGVWHDVVKTPLDASKTSKGGRLILDVRAPHGFCTVREDEAEQPMLETVFENGVITKRTTFDEVRKRAAL